MAAQITQSIIQRASNIGVVLKPCGDRVEAWKGSKIIAFHTNPTTCLDKATERLEAARLNQEDKTEDREPDLSIPSFLSRKDNPQLNAPAKINGGHMNGHTDKISKELKTKAVAIPPPPQAPEPIVVPPVVKADPGPGTGTVNKVIKGSIIKPKYKARYKKNGDYSCGDDVAGELRAYVAVTKDGHVSVDLKRLKEVAVTNGVWKESYGKLNAGQMRMTVGNCLRAKMKNGDQIDIGGAILAPPEINI